MLRDTVQSHGGLMLRCSVSFPGKELGDAPPTALGVLGKLVFPTQGPLPAHPACLQPQAPWQVLGELSSY